MTAADDDITAELEAAGKEFDKDAEIERILGEFRLDAYAVLDLQPGVPDSDIKKVYRGKSLLIHPDKTSNPKAPDAFDRLKKAQTVLLDEKERAVLDENISDARRLVLRDLGLTIHDTDAMQGPDFVKAWREKTKWVIMEETKRRQRQMQAQMREEGREQRKADEEAAERKRKQEHEKNWENTRDERIASWRTFQNGGKKTATTPLQNGFVKKTPDHHGIDKKGPENGVKKVVKKKPKVKMLG